MANKFIEVHCQQSEKVVLINLTHVEEIQPYEDGAVIFFAFTGPGAYEQDHVYVQESYDTLKRMLWRVNDGN